MTTMELQNIYSGSKTNPRQEGLRFDSTDLLNRWRGLVRLFHPDSILPKNNEALAERHKGKINQLFAKWMEIRDKAEKMASREFTGLPKFYLVLNDLIRELEKIQQNKVLSHERAIGMLVDALESTFRDHDPLESIPHVTVSRAERNSRPEPEPMAETELDAELREVLQILLNEVKGLRTISLSEKSSYTPDFAEFNMAVSSLNLTAQQLYGKYLEREEIKSSLIKLIQGLVVKIYVLRENWKVQPESRVPMLKDLIYGSPESVCNDLAGLVSRMEEIASGSSELFQVKSSIRMILTAKHETFKLNPAINPNYMNEVYARVE